MDYNFAFTDRDTYLAYRADWRAKYKAQTKKIRDLKAEHVAEMRSGKGGYSHLSLIGARKEANRMMLERTAATEFKNQQMATLLAAAA